MQNHGWVLAQLVSSCDQASIFTLHRDVCNFILNEVSETVNYFNWVMEKREKKGGKKEERKRDRSR